ncbi:DEAD/DEAH box helicase [Bartonella sp. HY761]|uniref:DEAD/DEAH box helicase n=1 Tax=Bartonella sp. HY761 TaxID=2979330 RepID=UPI0021FF9D76|nr:DEAD/DEAH box helicase [Bartonella sp. HY761]UXN05421.1 DEAD/DEAH box helicase [Bartonella sp. HY761]
MDFRFEFDAEKIIIHVEADRKNLWQRLMKSPKQYDLLRLPPHEQFYANGLAQLRALSEELNEPLVIGPEKIEFSHRLLSALSSDTADLFNLPPLNRLKLRTSVEGMLGRSDFRLHYEWFANGKKQVPRRTGAIIETSDGKFRLPRWIFDALEIADNYEPNSDLPAMWEALARFRKAIDPSISYAQAGHESYVSMTDFLSDLQISLVDRFSISPQDDEFDVVPFYGETVESQQEANGSDQIDESMSEVTGAELSRFKQLVRERGALNAYSLGSNRYYMVVERSAMPVLQLMAKMQKAPIKERRDFIENPMPHITQTIVEDLQAKGEFEGLKPHEEQELIESTIAPLFVETREFSQRVEGIAYYSVPSLGLVNENRTTWFPEDYRSRLREFIGQQNSEQLQVLRGEVVEAVERGLDVIEFKDQKIKVEKDLIVEIDEEIQIKQREEQLFDDNILDSDLKIDEVHTAPLVLVTKTNYDSLQWHEKLKQRASNFSDALPSAIITPLKAHQGESFAWQVQAWRAGLAGILNADEQGLGKTLQTISFLVWLKQAMAQQSHLDDKTINGPMLIVAPTTLLINWEEEVARHVDEDGLGHLIRLYGSEISSFKKREKGQKLGGKDIDDGKERLDFSLLQEAIAENRGHRFWMLTTYDTLTNYHISLGKIGFAAVVFDEIQNLKNPTTLAANAARSVKANFRIGLTGTPIENSTIDLWAIIDQLAPGSLNSLPEFRKEFGNPSEEKMRDLHQRLFVSQNNAPPLAIRRVKDIVARDLPSKTRKVHPRIMPALQARTYDAARDLLKSGGLGSQLKMLHHIRTVSVHPDIEGRASNEEFILSSARLTATMDILRQIRQNNERVLVFIESTNMQYHFIEVVKSEFGLDKIDLINGNTKIKDRQKIVNRFQQHLQNDGGFDLLVLSPKAAGTGLTLTAATHIIHLSRWWNPAVEEQCNDRIHRIGQTKPVTVHIPMAIHDGFQEHSFDCLLQSLMMRKRRLANATLWPMGDSAGDTEMLKAALLENFNLAKDNVVEKSMAAMFRRDGIQTLRKESDGSYIFN